MITTALFERDAQLLLLQLGRGRFAGYWLLPSATVDSGTLEETTRTMVLERSGYTPSVIHLSGMLEEASVERLILRMVYQVQAAERQSAIREVDIAQARWFSREAVDEILHERDIVPNLGVMTLLRDWCEARVPAAHAVLADDAACPCDSGFAYRGCCGWDQGR